MALAEHFAALADPQIERRKPYPLLDIITIALSAVICGAESRGNIAAFGETKIDW